MNIINFLEEFTTEKIIESKSSRRQMFGTFGSLSKKAAVAAIPLGLGTLASKAKASSMVFDGYEDS